MAERFAHVLAEEGVGAVTVAGGLPKALIPLLLRLGIKVVVVAPTVNVALSAETHGAELT